MPRYNYLHGLTVIAATLGLFLCSPDVQAANNVQVFPPLQPSPPFPPNTPCPQGETLALLWNGVGNVQCANVPTCTPAQGLQFDSATGSFICVTPCAGPQAVQIDGQACPAGQSGSIYTPGQKNCDGTITPTGAQIDTCTTVPTNIQIPAESTISCQVGQTITGFFDGSGNFNTNCNLGTCVTYNCTAGGLIP